MRSPDLRSAVGENETENRTGSLHLRLQFNGVFVSQQPRIFGDGVLDLANTFLIRCNLGSGRYGLSISIKTSLALIKVERIGSTRTETIDHTIQRFARMPGLRSNRSSGRPRL